MVRAIAGHLVDLREIAQRVHGPEAEAAQGLCEARDRGRGAGQVPDRITAKLPLLPQWRAGRRTPTRGAYRGPAFGLTKVRTVLVRPQVAHVEGVQAPTFEKTIVDYLPDGMLEVRETLALACQLGASQLIVLVLASQGAFDGAAEDEED